jgi:hypothetical protein
LLQQWDGPGISILDRGNGLRDSAAISCQDFVC